MRARRLACGVLATVVLSACNPSDSQGQRIGATGIVVASDGKTPLSGVEVDAYVVYFQVSEDVEIERRFEQDVTEPDGIRTDGAGTFRIEAANLALSYDWERDEWVCSEHCTDWDTYCELVTEDVCTDYCEPVTYEDCWDECWEECETVCYDEVVCDDDGNCWDETVCEEECSSSSCETVCETVTEDECYQECNEETYEVCEDVCMETVEECDWVTRTYTSYPELSEVLSTRSELILRDAEGAAHVIPGDTLEAGQAEKCDEDRCVPIDLWHQRDRFIVPFAP